MNTNYSGNAFLEINSKNLVSNINEIKRISKNSPIIAMIKGNAYGMGIEKIAPLLEKEGINYFGTGNINEALRIRHLLPTVYILNFEPLDKSNLRTLISQNISPVIMKKEDSKILITYFKKSSLKPFIFIEVNTGLNRWGCDVQETIPIIKKLLRNGFKIGGILTTLTERTSTDLSQIATLKKIQKNFIKDIPKLFISYASSQGILNLNLNLFDYIRPGIALYGIYPDNTTRKEGKVKLKPIFTLKSKVAQIRNIKKDEYILYKNSYVTQKNITILVVPIGYTDGYPVMSKKQKYALVRSKKLPIIALSMGSLIIDASKLKKVLVEDEVVLIGKQQSSEITLYDLSAQTGLSTYALMSSFSSVLKRIYI